jgi:hypothetical protein
MWTFFNSSGQQLRNTGVTALTQLDIDGGTDIGAAIVDADLAITAGYVVTGRIIEGETVIRLQLWDSTGDCSALTVTEFSATGNLSMTGSYEVN